MPAEFSFADGERLIRFGVGTIAEAPALLAQRGFDGFALLTTERALGEHPELRDHAAAVVEVQHGTVPEAAAAARDQARGRPLVALGGGRVVDAAKGIAAVEGVPVAALPTTLAGSPFTPFHRLPAGAEAEARRLVRPSLVVADPDLMASQPVSALTASAMNSLAHAVEALYGPLANPIAGMAALRAASTFAGALGADPDRQALAYAATLAGYAVGTSGFAIHHATCQTIVRAFGTPHAQTNAVLLPHSVGFMAERAPIEIGQLATALGDPAGHPASAAGAISGLSQATGVTRLADLGVDAGAVPGLAASIAEHPATANTPPGPPTAEDIAALLARAL